MKLSDYIDTYEEFTSIASKLSRNLCFAGIAIIWIFNVTSTQESTLPNGLFLPLLFFAVTLFFDLMQYVYGGFAYYLFYMIRRKKLKEGEEDKVDVDPPKGINIPTWTLFIIKILTLGIAYYYLIKFLFEKITFV